MLSSTQAAIEAAREFKYLLDIQPAGTLFHPRNGRSGTNVDARDTAGYKRAAALLGNLGVDIGQRSARPAGVHTTILTVIGSETGNGADAPGKAVDVLSEVHVLLVKLGFKELDQDIGSGENRRLFELRLALNPGIDQVSKLSDSVGCVVHTTSNLFSESHSAMPGVSAAGSPGSDQINLSNGDCK